MIKHSKSIRDTQKLFRIENFEYRIQTQVGCLTIFGPAVFHIFDEKVSKNNILLQKSWKNTISGFCFVFSTRFQIIRTKFKMPGPSLVIFSKSQSFYLVIGHLNLYIRFLNTTCFSFLGSIVFCESIVASHTAVCFA